MTQKTLSRPFPIHADKTDEALVAEVKNAIKHQLRLILARDLGSATKSELWMATSLAVKEMMIDRFIETQKEHSKEDTRRVYYLSLEYLMGRLLNVNLTNLGIKGAVDEALSELGFQLDDLSEEEIELEFNKILDGFSPIIQSVEEKFMEHRDEILRMKNV